MAVSENVEIIVAPRDSADQPRPGGTAILTGAFPGRYGAPSPWRFL